MATLNTPGPGPGEDGGQVVSLDAARTAHTGPGTPPAPQVPPETGGPVLDGEVVRVDQPGPDRADWLADLAARTKDRRPIIHPALRSRAEAAATVRWVAAHYRHVSLYHLVRVPKYGAKLAVRAPRGFTRTASRLTRWAYDLEGHPVRMATVLPRRPRGVPQAVPPAGLPRPAPHPHRHPRGAGRPGRRRARADRPGPGQTRHPRGSGGHLRQARRTGGPAADRPGRDRFPRGEADQ